MKFTLSREEESIKRILDDYQKTTLDKAKQDAVKDAADLALKGGRANIAAAGFGGRFQTALKKRFYPNKNTGNPAALIYHTRWFAGVFERGVTITGDPFLWLPVEQNLPRNIKSPHQYGRPLASVNVKGKVPMLFDAKDRQRGPLFVGVRAATIRKRLDLYRIFKEAADHIPEFLAQRLKGPE